MIANAHRSKRLSTAIAALLMVALTAGCRPSTDAAPDATGDDAPFDVVCTVGMVADVVRAVAGDRANVTNIIGEGVDPHLYAPTRADVGRLQAADVVFYAGLLLEGRMTDVLVKIARGGKPVFAVTERVDESYLLSPAALAGHHDPHVWMDVAGWSMAVGVIADALVEVDPAHAVEYRERAEAYALRLASLDDYVRSSIASIPEDHRVLVTAHDAFSYFGRAYGIDVLGIQGISTESEAGLDHINALVDRIVRDRVPAVFVESSVADKYVRELIEGARSRDHAVTIGGTLFSDAMGPPGTYTGTYIGMLDHNATVISRALGGTAPAGGFEGRLAGTEDHNAG